MCSARRLAVPLCAALLWAATATAPASAGGPAAGADALPVRLRAMTYNIHAGAGYDGRFDVARTAAVIARQRPDVVALQEVDVHWGARSQWRDEAREIADATRMRMFFAPVYSLDPPSPGAPREEFGVALLSRYPVLSAVDHPLTRLSTQVPDPVAGPAPGFPEIVIEVRGVRVRVYGTHLDYRADPSVRRLQVADMLRVLDADRDADGKSGVPQILMGDLNAGPRAPELAPLLARLTDTWAAAHPSAPGLTHPAQAPEQRIDYVLASPTVGVRTARVPATTASDHLPVVTDLALPPTPGDHLPESSARPERGAARTSRNSRKPRQSRGSVGVRGGT